jgi:hypothetical protein
MSDEGNALSSLKENLRANIKLDRLLQRLPNRVH